MTRKRWSENDLDLLRRCYADRTGDEMAAMLGRTRNAVQRMACLLGLRRSAAGRSTRQIRNAGKRRRGKPLTPEHLASLDAAGQLRRGRPITDEHRDALCAGARRRRERERQTAH
jgi:hypothetical protein